MPKLRHLDALGTARFITFSCYRRRKYLARPGVMRLVGEHIDTFCRSLDIRLHGYVLMPEHVHLVLTPPDSIKLGVEIGRLKARSARAVLGAWRDIGETIPPRLDAQRQPTELAVFWQPRCYDHNCRAPETVREKINYCHMNPVRRGLVSAPEQWLYSSYGRYHGSGSGPIPVDVLEL